MPVLRLVPCVCSAMLTNVRYSCILYGMCVYAYYFYVCLCLCWIGTYLLYVTMLYMILWCYTLEWYVMFLLCLYVYLWCQLLIWSMNAVCYYYMDWVTNDVCVLSMLCICYAMFTKCGMIMDCYTTLWYVTMIFMCDTLIFYLWYYWLLLCAIWNATVRDEMLTYDLHEILPYWMIRY